MYPLTYSFVFQTPMKGEIWLQYLKMVDCRYFAVYKEACKRAGPFKNDSLWIKRIKEAVTFNVI